MGEIFEDKIYKIESGLISDRRGIGLFRAIDIAEDEYVNGNDFAKELMKFGVLSKPSKNTLRFAPALIINEKQLSTACLFILRAIRSLERLRKERKKEAISIRNSNNESKKQ